MAAEALPCCILSHFLKDSSSKSPFKIRNLSLERVIERIAKSSKFCSPLLSQKNSDEPLDLEQKQP